MESTANLTQWFRTPGSLQGVSVMSGTSARAGSPPTGWSGGAASGRSAALARHLVHELEAGVSALSSSVFMATKLATVTTRAQATCRRLRAAAYARAGVPT